MTHDDIFFFISYLSSVAIVHAIVPISLLLQGSLTLKLLQLFNNISHANRLIPERFIWLANPCFCHQCFTLYQKLANKSQEKELKYHFTASTCELLMSSLIQECVSVLQEDVLSVHRLHQPMYSYICLRAGGAADQIS